MAAFTQQDRVIAAVTADPVCAAILERTPQLGLSEWWLTGGAVFQNVWNAVLGHPPGWGVKDYDLFYFDPDVSWRAEDHVVQAASQLFADLDATIEIRNQARVHLWYADRFGIATRPLASAREGIDSFVATSCMIGITRPPGAPPDAVDIYAPHGLDDVLAIRMRPNPRRPELAATYADKITQYRRRWPSLTTESPLR